MSGCWFQWQLSISKVTLYTSPSCSLGPVYPVPLGYQHNRFRYRLQFRIKPPCYHIFPTVLKENVECRSLLAEVPTSLWLSLATCSCTKCMDAALIFLHRQGICIINYSDDWLICAPTKKQTRSNTEKEQYRLVLMLNEEKSCLTPCRMVLYLGLVLDSKTMRACLHPRGFWCCGEDLPFIGKILKISEVWTEAFWFDGSNISGSATRCASHAAVVQK